MGKTKRLTRERRTDVRSGMKAKRACWSDGGRI